ncbi:MAG: sugar transferase [Planctomycetales bacterium]|nr:sugar transferase [Planctomycetales bacterium]
MNSKFLILNSKLAIIRDIAKRVFDVFVSLFLLILFSPVLVTVAILVRMKLGSPVLFRQQRPGLNCKLFTLYKFRTMLSKTHDEQGNQLPDEKRLTPFGLWLRAASVDELPELFNVLKGDMSLVGPRPLMVKYLSRYTPRQNRRHEVKPGITGWAQVNGRNDMTWEQKFDYDVWYVDHRSFGLDMKILWLTLWHVIARRGVAKEGYATVDEFFGTKSSQPPASSPQQKPKI